MSHDQQMLSFNRKVCLFLFSFESLASRSNMDSKQDPQGFFKSRWDRKE